MLLVNVLQDLVAYSQRNKTYRQLSPQDKTTRNQGDEKKLDSDKKVPCGMSYESPLEKFWITFFCTTQDKEDC